MIRMAHPTLENYGCSFYCRYNFKDEIYVSAFSDGKNAIQLASREWLSLKLQNYIGSIERSGTYTLSTAISQSYAFIYIRFGDSNGNWAQIIKIPTNNKNLEYVVFGSSNANAPSEAGRITFIDNSNLKYIADNISSSSQVVVKEIWQSNV